jgi:Rrf2 family nitric oxide-sensitive transcriptional repressor
MRLTSFTDYTLRCLIYLGSNRDRLATIQDIADLHNISKNHLTKVVHQLGASGLVETVRGRNGGLRLAREPGDINIGSVVRQSEPDFFIAECFDQASRDCIFTGACALQHRLGEAVQAFLTVLDGVTLADVLPGSRSNMGQVLLEHPVQLHRLPTRAKAEPEAGLEEKNEV